MTWSMTYDCCWGRRAPFGRCFCRVLINVLAVPEPRSAYFLLLVQEKVRKEKDPAVAAPHTNFTCAVPCAPRRSRTLAQLAGGVKATPLGLEHGRAQSTGSGSGARLALLGLNCNDNSNRKNARVATKARVY